MTFLFRFRHLPLGDGAQRLEARFASEAPLFGKSSNPTMDGTKRFNPNPSPSYPVTFAWPTVGALLASRGFCMPNSIEIRLESTVHNTP